MKLEKKNQWVCRGKLPFTVEIVCRKSGGLASISFPPESHWCMYAYIFCTHPLFDSFTSDCEDGSGELPFHCGCTYSKWDYDSDGDPKTKKYGSDYCHYGDESIYENPNMDEIPTEVLNDAQMLFDYLDGVKP